MTKSVSATNTQPVPDHVLDDVFAEIAAKVQAGQGVDVEAYAGDFPDLAPRIRQLVPAI
jgi:hypothetical protein